MSAGASVSRSVLKALSIFSGVQAISMICSIVRSKLIALWIGPAGVGLFAIYNSVLELVGTATRLNMRQSAVRDISSTSKSRVPFIAGVVRWWSRRLGLLGLAVMLAMSPLLSFISFGDVSKWWAFAALSLAMPALARSDAEQALLQGTGRLTALAKAGVRGAVVATAISIPMYYVWGEASIVPSLLVFAFVTMGVYVWPRQIKSHVNSRAENVATGRSFIHLGVFLTVAAVSATIASYAFLSYLNVTGSESTTGVFQAGYTIVIRYTGIIFTALAMEFYPRVAQVADRSSMASVVVSHEVLLILYVLTPLMVMFIIADKLALRWLYTDEFISALPFITIGAAAMIFRAVSYCMAYVIIGRGDGKLYVFTELLSTVIGLALNISFYHYWGFMGLGCSYVLWYIAYTIIVACVCYSYRIKLSAAAWLLVATSTAIICLSIWLKQYGWIAATPMLIPSTLLCLYGYRRLRINRH